MLIADGVVRDLRNFTPKNLVYGSLGQTIGEWLAFPVSDFLDDSFSDFRDCLTPGGGAGAEVEIDSQASEPERGTSGSPFGQHICLSHNFLSLKKENMRMWKFENIEM